MVHLKLREGIVMFFVIIIVLTLSSWAYWFLPAEFASRAQIPRLEQILVVLVVYCVVKVYTLEREIKRLHGVRNGKTLDRDFLKQGEHLGEEPETKNQ